MKSSNRILTEGFGLTDGLLAGKDSREWDWEVCSDNNSVTSAVIVKVWLAKSMTSPISVNAPYKLISVKSNLDAQLRGISIRVLKLKGKT